MSGEEKKISIDRLVFLLESSLWVDMVLVLNGICEFRGVSRAKKLKIDFKGNCSIFGSTVWKKKTTKWAACKSFLQETHTISLGNQGNIIHKKQATIYYSLSLKIRAIVFTKQNLLGFCSRCLCIPNINLPAQQNKIFKFWRILEKKVDLKHFGKVHCRCYQVVEQLFWINVKKDSIKAEIYMGKECTHLIM